MSEEKVKLIKMWEHANNVALNYDVSLIGKRQEALEKWHRRLLENTETEKGATNDKTRS